MTHIDGHHPDPREGKTVHVRFTTKGGVKVTRSCVFRPREFTSPSSQILSEDPLFRKPVEFTDIREVEPLYHRPSRHFNLARHQRIVQGIFGEAIIGPAVIATKAGTFTQRMER